MKTLVVYYSREGSNKFLAQKISQTLGCELDEIRPRLNSFLLFLMNIHFGIKALFDEFMEKLRRRSGEMELVQ